MQMKLIENIPFCLVEGTPLCLDLIMQDDTPKQKLPVIIYIHGGGWLA